MEDPKSFLQVPNPWNSSFMDRINFFWSFQFPLFLAGGRRRVLIPLVFHNFFPICGIWGMALPLSSPLMVWGRGNPLVSLPGNTVGPLSGGPLGPFLYFPWGFGRGVFPPKRGCFGPSKKFERGAVHRKHGLFSGAPCGEKNWGGAPLKGGLTRGGGI